MASPIPIPPNISDSLTVIWQQVAAALETGDTQQLQSAILDFISLSPLDKQLLEDLSSVIPYPGIPPLLISEIFANPEATIGVIDRLGPQSSGQELMQKLGEAEQAIVMNALIGWIQHEQQKAEEAKKETSQGSQQNPVNVALNHYIQGASALPAALSLGSLQFLKTNPITLAGLQIADPALLNQAYQIASSQLLLSVVTQIDRSAIRQTDPAAATQTPEQTFGATPEQKLRDAIRKGIEDQAIPLNPQVFLVLWTLVSMPSAIGPLEKSAQDAFKQSQQNPLASLTATSQTNQASAVTNADAQPIAGLLPSTPVITSWLTAAPILFQAEGMSFSAKLTQQLGLLSYVYTQMAPYWMGPGAVSLMMASGGNVTEQTKTESSVRAFAIGLGALLNDKTFDTILAALIKQILPSVTQEQLKAFIAAMKISILMNALVALRIVLLRKTQGQFSAQDLKDMILGKVPLPPDDLEAGLIKSIQAELKDLPESIREAFISNLLANYNEFMDIDGLIDPAKQFLNLCDPSFLMSLSRQTKG